MRHDQQLQRQRERYELIESRKLNWQRQADQEYAMARRRSTVPPKWDDICIPSPDPIMTGRKMRETIALTIVVDDVIAEKCVRDGKTMEVRLDPAILRGMMHLWTGTGCVFLARGWNYADHSSPPRQGYHLYIRPQ